MRSPLHVVLFALAAFVASAGCEPEIGSPCDPDAKFVDKVVSPTPGTNNLVQNVKLDNCKSQSLCASVDGSRGFCTVRCVDDLECAGAGDGFKCDKVIDFGPLACRDYSGKTDCLTETDKKTGAPAFSKQPLKYCTVDDPAVIEQRDVEFGRSEEP